MDKYYTNSDIAKSCVDLWEKFVKPKHSDIIIEPSAGSGAFLEHLSKYKKLFAYDIKPEGINIIKKNYLSTTFNRSDTDKIHVIGNPPFTLDIQFINHSAKFADSISFILPVKFNRKNIQNKVDPYFSLIKSELLPVDSFNEKGNSKSVRTVFQIWVKNNKPRKIVEEQKVEPKGYVFVKENQNPDIAINKNSRFLKVEKYSKNTPESLYFLIRLNNKNFINRVVGITKEIITQSEAKSEWVAAPHINKPILIKTLNSIINKTIY